MIDNFQQTTSSFNKHIDIQPYAVDISRQTISLAIRVSKPKFFACRQKDMVDSMCFSCSSAGKEKNTRWDSRLLAGFTFWRVLQQILVIYDYIPWQNLCVLGGGQQDCEIILNPFKIESIGKCSFIQSHVVASGTLVQKGKTYQFITTLFGRK